MYIRKFYHEALGQASYLVGCVRHKKAIVIDPARNVASYIQGCKEMGFVLEAVAETHIHADYVSGAMELWFNEECTWYFSRETEDIVLREKQVIVKDRDFFRIGDIGFKVIHTPGHTPEHVCYIAIDLAYSEVPVGIFSGDFLFVGDVGRPDLLEKVVGRSGDAKVSAKKMYSSIQNVSELPDYLQLWPSHGAGSLCGKSLGSLPSSTIGYERRTNWAFQEKDEGLFVNRLLEAQPEAPPYFAKMKQMNEFGPDLLKEVDYTIELLPVARLKSCYADHIRIVDTRPYKEFAQQHLPGSINIPLGKAFIQWSGWLLSDDRPFYILCKKEHIQLIKNDLLLIGLDYCSGFFDINAVFSEDREYHNYESIKVKELALSSVFLDVRQDHEWLSEHIPGAIHIPLGKLMLHLERIPRNERVVVYCQAGLRSAIAMSILKAAGFDNVINLEDGYNSWKLLGQPNHSVGSC